MVGGLKLEINIPSQQIRAKWKGGLINEGGVISSEYGMCFVQDPHGHNLCFSPDPHGHNLHFSPDPLDTICISAQTPVDTICVSA